MFDALSERRVQVGAATTLLAGLLFRFAVPVTGFVVFAGLFGGLAAVYGADTYDSPLRLGGLSAAFGGGAYVVLATLLGAGGDYFGVVVALGEAIAVGVFILAGGLAGGVVGGRLLSA